MERGRLEAFSDGVIAIAITVMVLELRPPHGANWHDLNLFWPELGTYALSFVFLAIYWNNHHHMFQAVDRVDGSVLWSNMHLLFWLSLSPFVTAWLGQSHLEGLPVAGYGFVLFGAAIAYQVLTLRLLRINGQGSRFSKALGSDLKGKLSVLAYLLGICLAFVAPIVSVAMYVAVALWWLVPDVRFERALRGQEDA